MRKYFGICVIIIGIISGIIFFNAGMKINESGLNLTTLRSVGGTTVAEAYYQEIGRYGIAYSYLYYAFGFAIISVSLGLGGILLSDNKTEKQNNPSGIGWYFEALKKYAVFYGRARRKEYWMFTLFFAIFLFTVAVIDETFSSPFGKGLYITLYVLVMLLPSISVSVRRLHDLGKSGWFYFINFIPLIGPIWFFVLMCTDGNRGENMYGSDPKAVN